MTDPSHSRRVSLLHALLSVDDEGTTLHMIDSDVAWWDREHYYDNERARGFVLQESLKVVYTLVIYPACVLD